MKRTFLNIKHGRTESPVRSPRDTTPGEGPGAPARWGTTEIAVSTFPQPESNLHSTLASILMTEVPGFIYLYVDRLDTDYVERYRHHNRIKIIPLHEKEWDNYHKKPNGWLASQNYMRILGMDKNNLVIFEDDIVCHDNWYDRMHDTIMDIEEDGHDQYVLSLYSVTLFTTKTKKSYAQFPKEYYAGCQGMYFPKRMIKSCRDFFWDELQAENCKPDVVVGRWAEKNNIPIFTPKYSLVQHIGKTSSMNSMWHESASFKEKII